MVLASDLASILFISFLVVSTIAFHRNSLFNTHFISSPKLQYRPNREGTALLTAGEKNNDQYTFGKCNLVEVCTLEKYCKRKGSPTTWKIFQELSEGTDIEIKESDCFMECLSGPNIRLDGDDRRIHGNITSVDDVKGVLGLSLD